MNTKLTVLVVAFGVVSLVGFYAPQKAEATDFPSVIQSIVDRFHLNKDEVDVMMQERVSDRQAEMRSEHEQALNKAVNNGILSVAQKDAILAKQKEVQSERSKNWEEHMGPNNMREHHEEMEEWGEKNGIDMDKLHDFMQGQMHGNRGRGVMRMGMGFER